MAIHAGRRRFTTTLDDTVTCAPAVCTLSPVISIIAFLRNTLWRGAQ
jgi:hypothetical protein